jgi:CubicO group peptidase (beta-lactamase class C family)
VRDACSSRIGGFFLCVSVLVGLPGLGPVAWAQPLSLAADPAVMGRLALGELKHGQAAVGIWRDGKAHEARVQAGDATPAAAPGSGAPPLFEIGSISKVFTGLLLAQAVERGDLGLDDRLCDMLAGRVVFSSPAVASITLRQLVTHSSCLPRLPPDFREAGPPESPLPLRPAPDVGRAGIPATDAGTPVRGQLQQPGLRPAGRNPVGAVWQALGRSGARAHHRAARHE